LIELPDDFRDLLLELADAGALIASGEKLSVPRLSHRPQDPGAPEEWPPRTARSLTFAGLAALSAARTWACGQSVLCNG
jgi:hypothetical protein